MLPDLYPIGYIEKAWDKYQHHRVLRVLKDGKWRIQSLGDSNQIDGVRAEVVKISSVMGFPKYLEKYCGS